MRHGFASVSTSRPVNIDDFEASSELPGRPIISQIIILKELQLERAGRELDDRFMQTLPTLSKSGSVARGSLHRFW
jgi:hypothetical protein